MKKKINIDKYVNSKGTYNPIGDYVFKQSFSILELKHANVLSRINRINDLCEKHIREWKNARCNWNSRNYEDSFLQEEIVFHLRRAVDDMISIAWIQNEWENDRYVSKIEIDSIGKYMNNRNTEMHCYDECLDFLKTINEISNSYKHSVYQTAQSLISLKEPGFYVYSYKYNDTKNGELQQIYSQSDLLSGFEKMFLIYCDIVYGKKV